MLYSFIECFEVTFTVTRHSVSVTVVQNFLNYTMNVITVLIFKYSQKVGQLFLCVPISRFVLRFALGGVAGRALGLELICIRRLELRFALP